MAEGTVLSKMDFSLGPQGGRCNARSIPLLCPEQQVSISCRHGQGQGNTRSERSQHQGCACHARHQGKAYHARLISQRRARTFQGCSPEEQDPSKTLSSRQEVRGFLASQHSLKALHTRHGHVISAVNLHADGFPLWQILSRGNTSKRASSRCSRAAAWRQAA